MAEGFIGGFKVNMKKIILIFSLSFLSGSSVLAQKPADDVVLNAMKKELTRSFDKLKNSEPVPLYYLNYEITDSREFGLSAVLGAVQNERDTHERYLDVDARVGSFSMDNTHEIKGRNAWMNRAEQNQVAVPVDDDEDALRSYIWKWTDAAYKNAQERYTKVKMNKAVTAVEEDTSDDFSKEAVAGTFYEKAAFPGIDKNSWREKLKKYSVKSREHDFIYDSNVSFSAETLNRYMASSEGSGIRTGNTYIRLSYYLATRTTDGMDLQRSNYYDADTVEAMPSDETVLKDIEKSIRELDALRKAPLVEPYTGPAILKNRAAGVFFHEIFGHRIEGHRQKSESEGQTFTKKINEKILPEFISVYDDPTVRERNGTFLRGYYKYDDQGVKSARASLVEKGVLRTFLMGRSPVKGFPLSNGHGRRSPGFPAVSRQGNLIVESAKTVPFAQLRRELIEECRRQGKPYGLVFDDISGGFTSTERSGVQTFKVKPLLVYRVYVDGRPDEIVRGVDIVGTPLASFSRIIMAGNDEGVFNGTCGAESGWVPVSGVSPSLLISEIEVEKMAKSQNKPPVLEPPYK